MDGTTPPAEISLAALADATMELLREIESVASTQGHRPASGSAADAGKSELEARPYVNAHNYIGKATNDLQAIAVLLRNGVQDSSIEDLLRAAFEATSRASYLLESDVSAVDRIARGATDELQAQEQRAKYGVDTSVEIAQLTAECAAAGLVPRMRKKHRCDGEDRVTGVQSWNEPVRSATDLIRRMLGEVTDNSMVYSRLSMSTHGRAHYDADVVDILNADARGSDRDAVVVARPHVKQLAHLLGTALLRHHLSFMACAEAYGWPLREHALRVQPVRSSLSEQVGRA